MDTLFVPTRKAWVFHIKAFGSGSGEIFDEQGEKIGSHHQVTVITGGKTELEENDGTKVCEVRQKIDAIQEIYEVKDGEGKTLGRIKKARTAITQPKLSLETADNKEKFEARGKSLGGNYVIRDVSGNEVANINKVDKQKVAFQNGMLNLKAKLALRINDAYVGKVDSRQLVGFIIAIGDSSRD